MADDGDYRHVPEPQQSNPSDGQQNDAAVLTPTPGDAATVQQSASTGGLPAYPISAFRGAMGSGGMLAAIPASVKTQNLLEDMLILSAPRAEFNGLKIPVLGGIHLLAKLGQGGMGAVYFGVHPRLHQEVAVKVLPFHLAEQEPGLVQRFIREAQIAAKVRSPHLVGVIDVNEENGLFYLVMEYVSGKSAGEYLRDTTLTGVKGLSEKTALAVCIGAAEGLAAAHLHGVIHRDIKPDNIMIPRAFISSRDAAARTLCPDETPFDFTQAKLADLGLARNESGDQSMTAINVCMGTPGFMSPEQASDAKHASKPADVFSLGATLYALLAGDSPFKGSSLMQTLNATVNERHAPIQSVRPDVSQRTAHLLDRCLAKAPQERFTDASVVLLALRQSLDALDPMRRTLVEDVATLMPSPAISGTARAAGSRSSKALSANNATDSETANPRARAGVVGMVAVFLLVCLAGAGVGGYFLWQKSEQDSAAARDKATADQVAREKQKFDDMRQTAFQEEQRLIDGWLAGQRSGEMKKRETAREAFAGALKTANDYRKNRNLDKAQTTLEEALANLGPLPSPSRLTALEILREVKEERSRMQAAFSSALNAAAEAKREQNLDRTIQILDDAFTALGPLPHTSRSAGEFMLESAKKERAQARDSFGTALKLAQEFKRTGNTERVILTLDDALKTLGTQPHPSRVTAESLLAETREERERVKRREALALDALPVAVNAAIEYKRLRNWDGVLLALEDPLKAVGTLSHPIRATAEAMIKESKEQKERQRLFKIEIEKGGEFVRAQNYESAKTVFENAKKLASEPSEVSALNEGMKRVSDGMRRVKLTQARLFMNQGRGLRPDTKGVHERDWSKAADAFKSAAAIFNELDEREDLARADVEQADCLRKDYNKSGDWEKAAGLYGNAAMLYGAVGDRKSQAESVSKHAACLDTILNPAGDNRQAAIFYGRAATLFGELGNKKAMADNLSRQGTCVSKEKNVGGSSQLAAEIFKRAAVVYEELGDKKLWGLCLFNQAACLIKERKANMTPEARALFQRAAKLSREGGDEVTAKLADDLLK